MSILQTCGADDDGIWIEMSDSSSSSTATSSSNLRQHSSNQLIESTTTSLGVFHHCPYCLYKNPILAHVRRHIMYKHTREKPFQCSFCLMRCTQKRDLQIHLRKHTGEKPYECSKCFRKFSTNSGLNKHLRNKKDCI